MEETHWLDADQQHSWRNLIVGMTLLTDRLDADLRSHYGISMPEYEILVRLSENDDAMRMAQLAGSMAHSRSRITHTISRLEKAGLVVREEDTTDGRGRVARMTESGRKLLESAAHLHVTGVREHLVDVISPEDFTAVGRAMNVVAERFIGPDDPCIAS